MKSISCLFGHLLAFIFLAALYSPAAHGQKPPAASTGRLKFEQAVTRDDLQSVNSVEISADGRFLYATPWPIGAIVVFDREPKSGQLTHVQTLKNPLLPGDTGIALSPSGKHAVAACFIAKTAVLMSRDPESGKLKILHSVNDGEEDVEGMAFPIDAIFSHDGRFVYVLDGGSGGIAIFKLDKDKLQFQEFYRGKDDCLAGSRGATLSPDGKVMYVASSRANALAVLDLNSETGRLKVKQVLWDEEDEIEGLAGVFGVVTTRNGEFIYTTSGRFNGDSAVSAFRRDKDGKLKLVHELIAEREELPLFLGGNRLVLSPDEKNIYAVGSRSGAVASFERDPGSGKIKVLETFTHDDVNGITAGAAGVAVSPDGKYVYIAAEGEATISIYTRRGATDEKKTEPEK